MSRGMSRFQELEDSQNRAARGFAVAEITRGSVQVPVENLAAALLSLCGTAESHAKHAAAKPYPIRCRLSAVASRTPDRHERCKVLLRARTQSLPFCHS